MFKNLLIFPLILICAEMAVFLSTDMYLPALPDMMHDLDVSTSLVQLTLSAWFLGGMSVQLFIGPICDRVGRRPVFITGMLIFVLSTFVCAIAPNISILIAARFFQGCTICFIIVPGYASIHELYDQKNSVRLLATMSSITVLAPALGPFLGGLLATLTNWRWIFLSLFVWGLLITGWVLARMPETLAADKRAPLNLPFVLGQYKSIVTNWQFMHYLLPYWLMFCGFMSWLVCGPFLVTNEFHYKPLYFGIFQLLVFGFYMVANRLVRFLVDKMRLNQLIELGLFILLAGSLFSMATSLLYPSHLFGLIGGIMLFAFGFGLSSASLQRLAIESSDAPMGSRMAVLSTGLGISGLLATGLVSLTYHGKLSSLASILFATAVCASLLYRSGKRYHSPADNEMESAVLSNNEG
ncbi:multidrug effflux MFS transporter [Legionella feeleii]|uniref:Bcr/CflA family efflux transporter n=1 Tax=Legionella feeleii TaxID=453 RepID=A0A378IXJ2_9GAMM|nr:multidrug effflux MFS transporter [Legionella feeleii]STX39957.1 multidrug efflux system protein [Legionella feeleii]